MVGSRIERFVLILGVLAPWVHTMREREHGLTLQTCQFPEDALELILLLRFVKQRFMELNKFC